MTLWPPRRLVVPLLIGASVAAVVSGGGSAAPNATPKLPNCNAKHQKIVLVVPLRIPIVDQLLVGSRTAAKNCNVNFSDVGPQALDPPAAIQAFQDAVAAGAKAIAFDALPADAYAKPVSKTKIPMAQYISALTTKGAPVYVGVNHLDFGNAIATLVINRLPKNTRGEVVVGNCAPGLLALDQRVDGIKSAFKRSLPNVSVKGPLETSTDPSQDFAIWQGIIQANPNALAFMGVCDSDLPSLTRIKQKDPASKYLLAGAEIQEVNLRGIKDGIVVGTVGQNPYLEGYLPIRLLAMRLAGTAAPATGWVNPGLDIVTRANVDRVIRRESSPAEARAYYAPIVNRIFANLSTHTKTLAAANRPSK